MLVLLCIAEIVSGQIPDSIGPDITPVHPQDRTIELPAWFDPSSTIFVLPTANPIGAGNGFISDNELLFLYGGVGIGDYVSLNAGMTMVPVVGLSSQVYTTQLKISVAERGAFNLAFGASASWLTAYNFLFHLYMNTTFLYDTNTWVTGMVYYKVIGDEIIGATFGKYGSFSFLYKDALGFAIGVESRVPGRSNMRFVGEAWFNTSAALMAGLRFGNDVCSSTFGFAVAGNSFPMPVTNFAMRW